MTSHQYRQFAAGSFAAGMLSTVVVWDFRALIVCGLMAVVFAAAAEVTDFLTPRWAGQMQAHTPPALWRDDDLDAHFASVPRDDTDEKFAAIAVHLSEFRGMWPSEAGGFE